MHLDDVPTPSQDTGVVQPWWREITRYHVFVLAVAAAGWLFDTMDQQLFILGRNPAMRELLTRTDTEGLTQEKDESDEKFQDRVEKAFRRRADNLGTWTTSIFLIGWATGGIIFGILGDRIGRVKTMLLTILVYSIFTGLSAFSTGIVDFCIYRILSGLGVGGEFAVGVALVAEVMPQRVRPFAIGLLQALSAVGNVAAAAISMYLGRLQSQGAFSNLFILGHGPVTAWRMMFLIGALPALLAFVIARRLREPERWAQAARKDKTQQLGSIKELFGESPWRRHALLGLILAIAGQIGLWGIGFYFPELTRSVFQPTFEAETRGKQAELAVPQTEKEIRAQVEGNLTILAAYTSFLFNAGAVLGIFAFSLVTHYLGRKPTFAISFLLALGSTLLVFSSLKQTQQVFWMIPLMGFCQLSLFGGYAIYFPELFPTRLRSTGTSFCYNIGRFLTAAGPPMLGFLISRVFAGLDSPLPYRYAGMTMCSVFLLGLVVLPFLPETKGKPLPE
jgi:MFS family permease